METTEFGQQQAELKCRELAGVDQAPAGAMALIINRADLIAQQKSVHNFDLMCPTDCALFVGMALSETNSIWDDEIKSWDTAFIQVKPAETIDEKSGEVKQILRTSFIGPNGATAQTGSATVAEAALALLSVPAFQRKFEPPLRIEFRRGKSRAKRDYLKMTISPEQLQMALQGK